MREHGAGGAFSAIFIDVVELATLIARTPRLSRLDASGAGVGWAGTSARPYCARSASAWSYFAVAAACSRFASRIAAFACSTASSALRFSLRATRPRQRWLSCFAAFVSRCAAASSTALSAAATFIACFFVPSTLRVSGAASLALGGPFRSGSRLGRDSRLGTPWMLL